MSLLDDVSIVVTPNGYKAGTLYGVLPVPIVGSELVTDGDFPTGTTAWVLNSNWSISNGTANADGTSNSVFWQDNVIQDTTTYSVTYTLSNFTQGSLNINLSGSSGVSRTSAGTYTETITSGTSPSGRVYFEGSGSFIVSVDNVSVKQFTASDMDVTRATAATRVDENGLVNYAHVVTGSDIVTNGDFSNGTTDWTLQNGWSLGTNDVEFNTSVSQYRKLFQENFLNIGSHYKLTFEIKSISSGSIANFGYSGSFDTIGVKTQIFTAIYDDLYLEPTGDAVLTIDNIKVEEVELDNVPRIDYTGGGCPHILAEPQRTNLITYSEDFSNAAWGTLGTITVTVDDTTSPSGDLSADKVLGLDSGSAINQIVNGTLGIEYTNSFYIKNVDATSSNLLIRNASTAVSSLLNWSGSVLSSITNTTGTTTFTDEGNGWYRLKTTYTSLEATQRPRIYPAIGTANTSVYIWGAQLEEGSYPTSYIPTSGSSVTRNQDIFTRDGIGSLIGQTEGTLFVELSKPILSPDSFYLISLNNAASNSDNNSVIIGFESGSDDFYLRLKAGGSIIYVDDNRNSLADTFYKIAIAYKSGASLIYIDGSPITPNSGSLTGAFSFSETLDNLSFDYDGDNGFPFYGKVRQLQVYNTALTDNQLIQLTGEAGTHFFESYSEMAETLTYTIQ